MENKVDSAMSWLKRDTAPPLPEDKKAMAANQVEQILAGFPVRTQMAILSVNLFRIVRKEQNIKLLSLFTKDIEGRYRRATAHAEYASPPPAE
jgi:hypothetical protein